MKIIAVCMLVVCVNGFVSGMDQLGTTAEEQAESFFYDCTDWFFQCHMRARLHQYQKKTGSWAEACKCYFGEKRPVQRLQNVRGGSFAGGGDSLSCDGILVWRELVCRTSNNPEECGYGSLRDSLALYAYIKKPGCDLKDGVSRLYKFSEWRGWQEYEPLTRISGCFLGHLEIPFVINRTAIVAAPEPDIVLAEGGGDHSSDSDDGGAAFAVHPAPERTVLRKSPALDLVEPEPFTLGAVSTVPVPAGPVASPISRHDQCCTIS